MATESIDNRTPSTLQKLITLRIEQLGDDSRQVLQCAAVIGSRFEYKLLRELVGPDHIVLDASLKQLEKYDLIYEKSKFPQKIYHFRHPGIRSYIYGLIPPKKKMVLHTLTGSILERVSKGNVQDNIHALAYHYMNSDRNDQALKYSLEMAKHLEGKYRLRDALGFYIKAYDLIDDLEDPAQKGRLKMDILRSKWSIYHNMGNYELALLCHDIFKSRLKKNDIREMIEAQNMVAQIHMEKGDLKLARALLSENLVLCRDREMKALLINTRCIMANLCVYMENADMIEEVCSKGLKDIKDDSKEKALFLFFMAFAHNFRNRYPEALKNFESALKIFEKIDERHFIARTLCNIGMVQFKMGNYGLALKNYNKSYEMLKEMDLKRARAITRMNLAVLYDHLGDYRLALKEYNAVLRDSESIGNSRILMMVFCNIGEVFIRIGKLKIAHRYLNDGIELASQIGARFWKLSGLMYLGICNYEQGDYEEAMGNLKEALELSRRSAEMGKEFECRIELLKVRSIKENTLKETRELCREIRQKSNIGISESINEKALHLLGHCEMKCGDLDRARSVLEEGYALATEMGHSDLKFNFLASLALLYDKMDNKRLRKETLRKALDQYRENISRIPSSSHKMFDEKGEVAAFLRLLNKPGILKNGSRRNNYERSN